MDSGKKPPTRQEVVKRFIQAVENFAIYAWVCIGMLMLVLVLWLLTIISEPWHRRIWQWLAVLLAFGLAGLSFFAMARGLERRRTWDRRVAVVFWFAAMMGFVCALYAVNFLFVYLLLWAGGLNDPVPSVGSFWLLSSVFFSIFIILAMREWRYFVSREVKDLFREHADSQTGSQLPDLQVLEGRERREPSPAESLPAGQADSETTGSVENHDRLSAARKRFHRHTLDMLKVGLLFTLLAAAAFAGRAIHGDQAERALSFIAAVLGFLGMGFLTGAIGLRKRKPWARKLTILLSWSTLLLVVLFTIFVVGALCRLVPEFNSVLAEVLLLMGLRFAFLFGAVVVIFWIALLVSLVYFAWLLFQWCRYLVSDEAKAICRDAGNA